MKEEKGNWLVSLVKQVVMVMMMISFFLEQDELVNCIWYHHLSMSVVSRKKKIENCLSHSITRKKRGD
jgi:hypothetical protein